MRKLLYILGILFVSGSCYSQIQGTNIAGNKNLKPNDLRYTPALSNWKERYLLMTSRSTGEPAYYLFNLRDSISALSTSYTITAGTGISAPLVSGNYTITNTAPDQTVTISNGTGITHSGSYPNFTITNSLPDVTVNLTGGGITNISGSYPNYTITSTEIDGSTTNELQTISKTGSTIYLSNGGGNVHLDSTAYQPLNSQLTTLSSYNSNGLITQTSAGNYTGRTLTGTTNQISVSNGNGVSGNPTISLPNDITISGNFKAGTFNGSALGTAAFTNSTAYEVPLSFSTGLTRTVNTITVNTSQNISTLSNLTSNGLIKTSGGTGSLSIATPSIDYTIPADLTVYLTTSSAANTYMPLTGAAFTTTTGIGYELTSSTLTSGSLFKLTGTSTANLTGAKMFEISSSGANSNSSVTKYGVYSSVTNTGTTSTNIAGYFSASGATTANYGLLVTNGSVGIGTSAPERLLDVRGTVQIKRSVADYLMKFYDSGGTWVGSISHLTTPVLAISSADFGSSIFLYGDGTNKASLVGRLVIPVAPTATANYGTLSIGNGAFDGSTSGYFQGSANGTLIAGNLASGSTADLMNLQVATVSQFKVSNVGTGTFAGNIELGSAKYYGFGPGRAIIQSIADGVIILRDRAGVSFTRLVLGTNSSSYPALTVSSSNLVISDGAGTYNTSLGIGNAPVASAKLDVASTTQGFLPPRMTTTQKNAISSPAEGLMVYDLTLHKLCVYTGSVWETVTSL